MKAEYEAEVDYIITKRACFRKIFDIFEGFLGLRLFSNNPNGTIRAYEVIITSVVLVDSVLSSTSGFNNRLHSLSDTNSRANQRDADSQISHKGVSTRNNSLN